MFSGVTSRAIIMAVEIDAPTGKAGNRIRVMRHHAKTTRKPKIQTERANAVASFHRHETGGAGGGSTVYIARTE